LLTSYPLKAPGATGQTAQYDRAFLDELAVELVSEAVRVEARLVSAGFCDPLRLLDAGETSDLRGVDFADALLGLVYASIWWSVADDGQPFSACGGESVARAPFTPVPPAGLVVYLEAQVFGLEVDASNIDLYAQLVKRAARRRQRLARQWQALIHRVRRDRDVLAALHRDRTPESFAPSSHNVRLRSDRAVAAVKGGAA